MSELMNKITDIQKIAMSATDVMVIRADIGTMPAGIARQHMQDIKEAFSLLFLSQNIIVIPSTFSIDIITREWLDENAGH